MSRRPLPPLPPEFKHGALFVVVMFAGVVALYLLAGWTPAGFWSFK